MSTTVNQIEKTNLLRKEFLEVKINHDELLSLDQFYLILDKKVLKTKNTTLYRQKNNLIENQEIKCMKK